MSSQQDAIAGCAGVTSILKQFPVQALAGTTRASPLTCLNGRLQVAMADAYPATPPGTVFALTACCAWIAAHSLACVMARTLLAGTSPPIICCCCR